MKKLVIGLFALASVAQANAQESNVLSAWEYSNVYTSEKANGNMGVAIENLFRAKEAIDAATLNEKTMLKSKTWKRRADIYVKLLVEKDPQVSANKADYLKAAYESVIKATTVEVDQKNGKVKIAEENELRSRASYIADTLGKVGGASFKDGDYAKSGEAFEQRYNLLKGLGYIDTVSYSNMFLSAYKAKDTEKAIKLGNELMQMNYPDPNLYGTMAKIYQEKGEGAKGLQIIKDAKVKYPKNTEFITEELNYYLSTGDNENAAKVMSEAFKAFEGNNDMLKALYFNSGVIYAQLNDIAKSREYYEKAIAIDPKYFGALNNLASLQLDEANALIKEANGLPLNESKKYNELKAKSDEKYIAAATILENAYKSKSEDIAAEKDQQAKHYYEQQLSKLKAVLFEIFSKLDNEAKMNEYK
jgi:tetratricopeptide (TPR) repeat protein